MKRPDLNQETGAQSGIAGVVYPATICQRVKLPAEVADMGLGRRVSGEASGVTGRTRNQPFKERFPKKP